MFSMQILYKDRRMNACNSKIIYTSKKSPCTEDFFFCHRMTLVIIVIIPVIVIIKIGNSMNISTL